MMVNIGSGVALTLLMVFFWALLALRGGSNDD